MRTGVAFFKTLGNAFFLTKRECISLRPLRLCGELMKFKIENDS
jgi:hypothetical protein